MTHGPSQCIHVGSCQGTAAGRGTRICSFVVFDALNLALADYDDPLLENLVLDSVTPAPSASRVQVLFIPANDQVDISASLARLEEIAGELRTEVAAEVSRRKVPELVFRVQPRLPSIPPPE